MSITPAEIDRIYDKQRAQCAAVAATTARERRAKLRLLHDALFVRREEIRAAVWSDFRKPATEVDLSEIWPVAMEARHAMRHLRKWMKPERVRTPLALIGTRSEIRYEPKGVVLIIAPWNFPLNLTFGPLVSAIAAGNCVMIKPSEVTPATSALMRKIVEELFDESEVAVVEGEVAVAQHLLSKRFDHIFFTGSPRVGREVMKAAASHLTPVTLELGGKSPTIVDETADLDLAAAKIGFAKFLNAGQACIAPDYILLQRSVREKFLQALAAQIAKFSGQSVKAPGAYARIVNDGHFARLERLMKDAGQRGAKVVQGGASDAAERFMEPTVMEGVPDDAALMQEEIFGPALPIVEFDSIDEAIESVLSREKPLTLYLFSRDRGNIERVLSRTSSGSVCVNDTLSNFLHVNAPFGGVGESGIGKAHGREGFLVFSNAKPVVRQLTRFSTGQLLYPPDSKLRKWVVEMTIRYF